MIGDACKNNRRMKPKTLHPFDVTAERRLLKMNVASTPEWAVFLTVAKDRLTLAGSPLADALHRLQEKGLRLYHDVLGAYPMRGLGCAVLCDGLQMVAIPVWRQASLENVA